jgi:site-specific DNA-methyltransferase (adenine-specific)
MTEPEPNLLYYGDNLEVLRRHVKDESVDLVYLDPPFNSNATYNVLFSEHGEKAAAQMKAFTDTWEWNTEARAAYEEVVEAGGKTADTMRAYRTMLGGSDMLAYLSMMAPRLIELRRVLKPTGSIYLHCDPTASHYLKLLLDAIFGSDRFVNEIIWHYKTFQGRVQRYFARKHDVLLLYSKGRDFTFNQSFDTAFEDTIDAKRWARFINERHQITGAHMPTQDSRFLRYLRAWEREHGRSPGPDDVVFEVLGQPIDSVWDMKGLDPKSSERLGYPTQKPIALLERIISASSKPGDVVLDPFCGCGTAIDASQELGRRWIGIDITHLSIGLIKHRLVDRYGPEIAETYRVIGEPTTADDAAVLAHDDPFQFQAWALGLVGARVAGSDKKGGDKGIDGRLYFHEWTSETRQIVFSVKAGHLVPNHVRDLRGVIEREKAEIGVLISFEEPTAGMRSEAAEAGFYRPDPGTHVTGWAEDAADAEPSPSPWGRHPRIQLRMIRELLNGRGIDYPHVTGANITLRKAQRIRVPEPEPLELFEKERAAEESEPYDSN